MSLHRAWMLLLVVATLGCGENPEEPEPEEGRDAVIAEVEKLGGKVGYDEENPERPVIEVRFKPVCTF